MNIQAIRSGLMMTLLAAALALIPVLAVGAQSYDGDSVDADENGDYAVVGEDGDTVTLTDVGNTGDSLDVTFAGNATGTISVTTSTTAPTEATEAVPGTANIFLDIDLSGLSNSDIESAVYTFTVSTAWLTEQGLESDNVFLYHWDGSEWERLSTTEVSSTDTSHTYEAIITSFSPFAVSGVQGLSNTGAAGYMIVLIGAGLATIVATITVVSRKPATAKV